jgi:hypothetical protein
MAFTKEDFTEDELILLNMAFEMLDIAVDEQRRLFYAGDYRNTVYDLKNKLGIYDLLD